MQKEWEIVFIRHGKTPSNEQKKYLGKTQEDLSEAGRREVAACKDRILGLLQPQMLFSSPMIRCESTLRMLYGSQAEWTVIPQWSEIDFGEFEGKNYQQLQSNPDYQAWIDSMGTLPFPNGESRQEFIDRSLTGFYQCIFCMEQNKAEKAVAVVHGGTIMAILSSLTQKEYYDFMVKNAAGYRMKFRMDENRKIQIKSLEKI